MGTDEIINNQNNKVDITHDLYNYITVPNEAANKYDATIKRISNDPYYIVDDITIDNRYMKSPIEMEDDELAESFRGNASYTSASFKFVSTGLGQHLACNPKPQFTRYCDVPAVNFIEKIYEEPAVEKFQYNIGMGRYYGESIDDNATLLYLQFGVPKFNGLLNYLAGAIDLQEAILANTGGRSKAYTIGKIIGVYTAFVCFPAVSTIIFAAKLGYAFFASQTSYDYYYMKPAMHSYWGAVNTILMQFVSELKLTPNVLEKVADNEGMNPSSGSENALSERLSTHNIDSIVDDASATEITAALHSKSPLATLKAIYPDIISDKGFIDVFALSLKPQIRYRAYLESRKLALLEGRLPVDMAMGTSVSVSKIDKLYYGIFGKPKDYAKLYDERQKIMSGRDVTKSQIHNLKDSVDKGVEFSKYIEEFVWDSNNPDTRDGYDEETVREKNENEQVDEATNEKIKKGNDTSSSIMSKAINRTMDKNDNSVFDFFGKLKSNDPWDNFMRSLSKTDPFEESSVMANWKSLAYDGGGYAIFHVQAPKSVSDSFSNSIEDVPVGSAAKSIATASRQFKFNTSGGNLGYGIDIGAVVGAATNLLGGIIDSVTGGIGGGIATILGNAFVDMPKMWSDSDMSIGGVNYTLELRSPYGNSFSQLQNIYIPLSMILAGALPQRTGHSSYASPYLCSAYCQGMQNVSLGMITSLTIERGVCNVPYNKQRRPMGFNVNFTVSDFSNLVTTPITSTVFDIFKIISMDDTQFGRYVGTLTGRSFTVNKYTVTRVQRKWDRMKQLISSGFGAANVAYTTSDIYNNTIAPIAELTMIPTLIRFATPYGATRH